MNLTQRRTNQCRKNRKEKIPRHAAPLDSASPAERGDSSTITRCAPCADKGRQATKRWRDTHPERPKYTNNPEKKRLRRARYYAAHTASGICTTCGKTQLPTEEVARGRVNCAACRAHNKIKDARARQKRLDIKAGIPEGKDYQWPSGERPAALPGGPGIPFCCDLDRDAQAALLNLWDRYKKSEIAAGRQPRNRRVSRLVREAIYQWKDRLIGPSPYPHTLMVRTIVAYLDRESWQILEWQARACFKGNKSAALRMILTAVGYPRPIPVAIPRRCDKWYEEPE